VHVNTSPKKFSYKVLLFFFWATISKKYG
jgi:hypothetical protein